MAEQESTGPERAEARAEGTAEREGAKQAGGVQGREGGHSREGNVNSGGQGLKGKIGDIVGGAEEVVRGSGLVVGAGAYNDGAVTPNPYYQYGTVDTGGYGGPPNIRAVSHVFDKARHDALIFAGSVVDDTTGNAAAYGQGVGTGLAPELVNMPPMTGQEARDAAKANVDAAATYQTGHPVMIGMTDEQIAAGQEADEFGNPLSDDDNSSATSSSNAGDTRSRKADEDTTSSDEGDYSDHSDQPRAARQSQGQSRTQEPGRKPVDPTRGGSSSS